ncbi:MAG TPA: type II secretion system protein [Chthoniobacteraceae bacterium]|nr:type II secretion system protein [Chthoniobacteraceae bacterium]
MWFAILKSKRAFTLLELLIGIALVAIVAGLLFAALSRTSDNAKTAGCVAKLRQLGVAINLWRQDRQDRFAPPLTVESQRPSGYLYEGGVVPSAEMMCCPAADSLARGAWYDVPVMYGYGTAYQRAFLQQPVSYGVNAFAFYQSYPSGWGGGITRTTTYRMFTGMESNVPLMMDAHGFQVDHGMWKDPARARFAYRHRNRCHVVFLDGHLESLDPEGVDQLHPLGIRGKIYGR